MSDEVFKNVPVRVVRSEEQGAYIAYADFDGVSLVLGARKLGTLDQRRAANAALKSARGGKGK